MTARPGNLDKAFDLLKILGATGQWTGVRDLARHSGYHVSSVHGLLVTMLEHGFVEYHPELKQYRLGLALPALANARDANDSLTVRARTWVMALADELRETFLALVWCHGRAVIVAMVESPQDVHFNPARRLPTVPHTWACGQILLAYADEAERESYLRRVAPVPADADTIRSELAEVRQRGWALVENAYNGGIAALAVPVRDRQGRCVLALGSRSLLTTTNPARLGHLRERLLAYAADIGP